MKLDGLEQITKEQFPLSTVSSMRTGGEAALAVFPETEAQLPEIIKQTASFPSRHIIGNASNVLFPDDASEMCVIFTEKLNRIEKVSENVLYAMCGAQLTALSVFAKNNSLSGLEFAYGIPGTVGGGIFMNAGAYGGEMSQVIKEVRAYDCENNSFLTIPGDKCNFGYRKSIFQDNRSFIAVSALFELKKGIQSEIDGLCRENMRRRREKQPLEYPSCGSAFKRPQGNFAGKLIEDCGLKGFSIGKAAVSEKHAGFIINLGGATSNEILALIAEVKKRVFEKFGVELQPEIEIIEK